MAGNISENAQIVLGNTKIVRDFVFIDDVVEGFIKLLLAPASSGDIFNVSTGIGHSVEELVSTLSALLHYRGSIIVEPDKIRPNERKVLIASNERLKSLTGWKTRYSLEDGLTKTVSHYKKIVKSGVSYAL